jgi:hypothetical protein
MTEWGTVHKHLQDFLSSFREYLSEEDFRKGDCREKLKAYFMHNMPLVFLMLYGFRGI